MATDTLDIARIWTDETYRRSLSSEQLARVPANPIGELELVDISTFHNDPNFPTITCSRETVCLTHGPCCNDTEINMTFGPCCF